MFVQFIAGGCEQQSCNMSGGCGGDSASSCRSLETGSCTGSGGQGHNQPSCVVGSGGGGGGPVTFQTRRHSITRCYDSCCAESAKKVNRTF